MVGASALAQALPCLLRRAHSAGVCCILCSPWQAAQVCTGSYDEHVRLWDMRQLTMALETAKVAALSCRPFPCSSVIEARLCTMRMLPVYLVKLVLYGQPSK